MATENPNPSPARVVDDARGSVSASAAGLAAIAQHLAEAAAEPTRDARTLRQIALTVQALGHRAGLVAAGATFAAGQLAAFAHVQAEAYEHAMQEIEAEAERDAALYLEDRRDNPETCPGLEEWRAEMFAENWAEGWDELGVERERAEALYWAAFERAVTR